jgi:hypothetical protein
MVNPNYEGCPYVIPKVVPDHVPGVCVRLWGSFKDTEY